ncbi:MAG: FG-GAP repeat protein [Planctomycetes bacterium]|nr:FG-GAP repeat protein [Planctomycetota bacterium]
MSAPMAGQTFGHSIAIADVDGDGVHDLVVSAHGYNGSRGRVYESWGDNSASNIFGIDPTLAQQKITAIDAPGIDSVFGGLGLQACNNPWGIFGLFQDAADIDGDGKADLLIGEPLYPQIGNASCNNYGGPTRVGRAHIYRGFQIQKPASPGLLVSTALPRYTLVPPNRNNGSGPAPQVGENFGYYLWILDYDFDGDLDVIVHSETANYTLPSGTAVPAAGSLYCYSNSPGSSGDILLDIDSLRRPKPWLYSSIPMTDARYGKWIEVGWWRLSEIEQHRRAFFVGEPDITVNGVRRSGRVLAYIQNGALAIPQQFEYTTYSIQEVARVTGDVFGFSPQGGPNATSQVMEAFGRWFAAANFSLSSGSDRRELIITASGRDVWQTGTQLVEAGAAKIVKAK